MIVLWFIVQVVVMTTNMIRNKTMILQLQRQKL